MSTPLNDTVALVTGAATPPPQLPCGRPARPDRSPERTK